MGLIFTLFDSCRRDQYVRRDQHVRSDQRVCFCSKHGYAEMNSLIKSLDQIKCLNLEGTGMNPKVMMMLPAIPSLVELRLDNNPGLFLGEQGDLLVMRMTRVLLPHMRLSTLSLRNTSPSRSHTCLW